MDDTNRETGKIIFFDKTKDYGFIKPDAPEQRDNVFLHKTNIKTVGVTEMAEGTAVEYQAVTTDRGLSAEEVTVA